MKTAAKKGLNQRKCDSHGENDGEVKSSASDIAAKTACSHGKAELVMSSSLHEKSKLAVAAAACVSTTASPTTTDSAKASTIPTSSLLSAHDTQDATANKTDVSNTLAQEMERNRWRISANTRSKRLDYERVCSICLSDSPSYSDDIDFSLWHWLVKGCLWRHKSASCDVNPLISPCLCAGKRSHQHKRCIENWIEQTGASDCPFCFVRYEYSRKPRSFWSYVKDCELERDLYVSLATFAFASYLFLVGLSVCHHYVLRSDSSIDAIDGFNTSVARCFCDSGDVKKTQAFTDCSRQKAPSATTARESKDNYHDAAKSILADLEGVLACHLSSYWCNHSKKQPPPLLHKSQQLLEVTPLMNDAYSGGWVSLLVFCFVSSATVLLLIGIISMGLNMAFRHYVRYWLWSRTHFRVEVKPYSFEGAPSEPIGDGLRAVEQSIQSSG